MHNGKEHISKMCVIHWSKPFYLSLQNILLKKICHILVPEPASSNHCSTTAPCHCWNYSICEK